MKKIDFKKNLERRMVNHVLFIGLGGLLCSFIYRIPQIHKLYTTRSAKDISTWMVHVQNISYVLYIAYGFLISDIVYIVSSIISILQNLVILYMYYKFSDEVTVLPTYVLNK
jgi:MtN3 and saliva related transmembrane protein